MSKLLLTGASKKVVLTDLSRICWLYLLLLFFISAGNAVYTLLPLVKLPLQKKPHSSINVVWYILGFLLGSLVLGGVRLLNNVLISLAFFSSVYNNPITILWFSSSVK